MPHEHALMNNARALCGKLVREHLPHEADIFDDVWEAIWASLDGQSLDDMAARPDWRIDPEPVRVLGAIGGVTGDEIDAVHVICPVTTCIARLRTDRLEDNITTDDIVAILEEETLRIDTPKRIQQVLLRHATAMLAELFGVAQAPNEAVSTSSMLWVEWYDDLSEDPRGSLAGAGHFELDQADEQFREDSEAFDLFVDEQRLDGVLLPKQDLVIPWVDLQARHSVLLGMILSAFRTHRPILFDRISDKTPSSEGTLGVIDDNAIRKTKHQLNEKLDHILDDVVVAKRGMKRYEIRKQLLYCWIRPGDKSSRLFC